MAQLPSGTVAFLFTDIEGSTKRWQRDPRAMAVAVARHDELLRGIVGAHEGAVFKTVGDAFCVAFPTAVAALTATIEAQQALAAEPWGEIGPIKVRMAIHVGAAEERDNDYFGPAVNRVARLLSAGHGGQVLLSSAATELLRDSLPPDASVRDLGEHRLKDLARPEQIYQLVVPGLQTEFAPLVTQEHHPHNLPPQLTTLIGRDREIAEIRDRLRQEPVRLVTLTGPGGVGKTRLGLQVGAEALEEYGDGVWFVPLDTATDEASIVAELATTFGVREVADRALLESLTEYLRDKHLLVILDNFEQVAHAAPLIARLLRAAPRMQALVTSRTRLGIQGEHELVVPPLAVPDPRHRLSLEEIRASSAVSLFVQRASAARSDFDLTERNATAVTEICRGLDSLPLAIELAAARVKLLPPEALLSRMEQRLGLLTGGRGDRPARHQTLRATISWSFDLLAPEEQLLFARLATFAGGFTFDAAEFVCNVDGQVDVFGGLAALVDHSLIRQQEDATGEPRFAMLTTIREFAQEQLRALPDDPACEQHARWCLALVEEAEPQLKGRMQQEWLDRLETEHDNIRASLVWAESEGYLETMLQMAGLAVRFWEMRGYLSEGRRWLSPALAAPESVPAPTLARALTGLARLMTHQGDHTEAAHAAERALALSRAAEDGHGTAEALLALAIARLREGEIDEAGTLFDESRSLFDETGDRWGAGIAVTGLAAVAHERLDHEAAEALYGQGRSTFQALGDQRNTALALNNLATVAHDRKDYARASTLYAQSAELTRALEDRRTRAMTLNNQAIVAHDQGEYEQAMALYDEALAIFRDLGDRHGVAYLLLGLGMVADDKGSFDEAVRLHEESLALFEAIDDRRGIASAQAGLAEASYHLGQMPRGRELFLASLAWWLDHDDEEGMVECLDGLARMAVTAGDHETAARLFAAGAALHEQDGMSLSPDAQAEYEQAIATARAALGSAVFERAWADGTALGVATVAAEVLDAAAQPAAGSH